MSIPSGEESVVNFLKNSTKGRIIYETGWDLAPNSTWQLISKIQAEDDEKKSILFERAIRVSQKEEIDQINQINYSSSTNNEIQEQDQDQQQNVDGVYIYTSPLSNSSTTNSYSSTPTNQSGLSSRCGSAGKASALKNNFRKSKSPRPNRTVTFAPTDKLLFFTRANEKHGEIVTEDETLLVSKKGYGILDEEEEVECTKSFYRVSPYQNLKRALEFYEEKRRDEVMKRVYKKAEELNAFDDQWDKKLKEKAIKIREQIAQSKLEAQKFRQERESLILKEFEERQQIDQRERELEEEQKNNLAEIEFIKIKEQLEAQKAALAERQEKLNRELAEQQQKQQQQQQQEEINRKLAQEKELQQQQEQQKEQQIINLSEATTQQQQQQTPVIVSVKSGSTNDPENLADNVNRNILKNDLTKYSKSQTLIEDMKKQFEHISASNPSTKTFYFNASKNIQTPMNSIGADVTEKIKHFEKLLLGQQVNLTGVQFSSTEDAQGELFVFNFLANRFVKKSEAEITKSGKGDMSALAKLGVHLCLNFPLWATLLEAYLYKYCPFLVPFSVPRGDMTIASYCSILGHENISSAHLQTLLGNINGYCTLYGEIVKLMENQRIDPNLESEALTFFSISGAWHIIVATMKLEPQLDVTATVLQTLLETLGSTLSSRYKSQFNKLIHYMITNFLPKMHAVSPPGKSGSFVRFQIFLESKLKTGF